MCSGVTRSGPTLLGHAKVVAILFLKFILRSLSGPNEYV